MPTLTQCRFIKRDIGKPHRTLDSGDCTARALAMAARIPYPQAWQLLYDAQGRHKTCGFTLDQFMREEPATFGVVRQLPFPAKRGEPRMTANEFAERYPSGSFILSMAHHVAAMEDGILYDKWDCRRKCVYTAFEIDQNYFK